MGCDVSEALDRCIVEETMRYLSGGFISPKKLSIWHSRPVHLRLGAAALKTLVPHEPARLRRASTVVKQMGLKGPSRARTRSRLYFFAFCRHRAENRK